jgi:hypothetical protein
MPHQYKWTPNHPLNKTGAGPELINQDKYTGVFTGEKHVAKGYGVPYQLASKKSSNALTVDALQSGWYDIKIPSSKVEVERGLELAKKSRDHALKNPNQKFGWGGDENNFLKRANDRVESYENLLKNWDEVSNDPNYKALLNKKADKPPVILKSTGRVQGFATDDVAKVMEDLGLNNLHLKNIYDGPGELGNILIHNQLPGNYLKSLEGNTGMFDMTNPDIYKKDGGKIMKYGIGGVVKNNADAEIEGGEIILTQQGAPKLDNMSGLKQLAPNAFEVIGKSHEEGGIFAKFGQGETTVISTEYANEMKTALALLSGDKIEQNQAQRDIQKIINTQQINNGNNINVTMARYGMKKYDNGGRDFTSPVDNTYVASPLLDEAYMQQMLDAQPGSEIPFDADKILNPNKGMYLYETRNRPDTTSVSTPSVSPVDYPFFLDAYRDEINRIKRDFAETPIRNAEYIENVTPGSAGGTQAERDSTRYWNDFLNSYMTTGMDTINESVPNQRRGSRNIKPNTYRNGGRLMKGEGGFQNFMSGLTGGGGGGFMQGLGGILGAIAPYASSLYNIISPMLQGDPDLYNPEDFYAPEITDRVAPINQSAKMTSAPQMDAYAQTAPMMQLSTTAMNNYSGPQANSYRQALLSDMAPKMGDQFAQIDYMNQLAKERMNTFNFGVDQANVGVDMANANISGQNAQIAANNQAMNWQVNQYNDQLSSMGPAQTATGFNQLSNTIMGQQYNQTLQDLSNTSNYNMGQFIGGQKPIYDQYTGEKLIS